MMDKGNSAAAGNKKQPPPAMTEEEKAQKALLKQQRKAEFEAKFKKEQTEKKKPDAQQGKSKSQLKAERRAVQEAQRAAKSGNVAPAAAPPDKASKSQPTAAPDKPKPKSGPVTESVVGTKGTASPPAEVAAIEPKRTELKTQDSIGSNKELADKILSHLPRRISDLSKLPVAHLPPIVIRCGYQIHEKTIDPSSRCVLMLLAFGTVVSEYQPKVDLKRELQTILFEKSIDFLNKCCPTSISMINACKYLKSVFSRIETGTEDSKIRDLICQAIEEFIEIECICSRRGIAEYACKKIFAIENQTILTLGYSALIKKIFLQAINNKIKFKVVVVDTRPRFEGRKMVEFLAEHDVPTTYILINAIPYIMNEVNKVMFEAHSVFCNGYVMSAMGGAQISMVAQAYNVPVMACCETYKYSDRAYTDSFMYNEMGGNTESFFEENSKQMDMVLRDPKISAQLTCLDLLYDLVPREFVSAIITEKGLLPCSSVPAILRFRENK